MYCNFWEKCINSHKIGQGCSTPLKLWSLKKKVFFKHFSEIEIAFMFVNPNVYCSELLQIIIIILQMPRIYDVNNCINMNFTYHFGLYWQKDINNF